MTFYNFFWLWISFRISFQFHRSPFPDCFVWYRICAEEHRRVSIIPRATASPFPRHVSTLAELRNNTKNYKKSYVSTGSHIMNDNWQPIMHLFRLNPKIIMFVDDTLFTFLLRQWRIIITLHVILLCHSLIFNLNGYATFCYATLQPARCHYRWILSHLLNAIAIWRNIIFSTTFHL